MNNAARGIERPTNRDTRRSDAGMGGHQLAPISHEVGNHRLRPTRRVRGPFATVQHLPVGGADHGGALGSAYVQTQQKLC